MRILANIALLGCLTAGSGYCAGGDVADGLTQSLPGESLAGEAGCIVRCVEPVIPESLQIGTIENLDNCLLINRSLL